MRLKEWYNLRFEFRSNHIRETTFARFNTRLVAHVVSRYLPVCDLRWYGLGQ